MTSWRAHRPDPSPSAASPAARSRRWRTLAAALALIGGTAGIAVPAAAQDAEPTGPTAEASTTTTAPEEPTTTAAPEESTTTTIGSTTTTGSTTTSEVEPEGVEAAPVEAEAGSAPATAAVPEWFEGTVDEFYVVPDPLPAGEPGELIRLQQVSATTTHTTLRIMYHSRDAADVDRAVTGKVTYPNATPPPGGWPVVSWAHGTTGMATQCAPSRSGRSISTFGVDGVAVESDYIGLGPVGELHPYLSRLSEGHSVIDAVRAARNIPDAHASNTWVAIGGSQGGHGAMSANELGQSYAPELDLRGAVAAAPGAMFNETYPVGLDPFVYRVTGAMLLFGAATEHAEIDPADYVSPEGLAAAEAMKTGCLTEITVAVLGVPFDSFYEDDPALTEPARSILSASDVGHVRVTSPLLLIQGTADTTVVPERTRDLYARLCTNQQTTEYIEYEGADHGNIFGHASAEVTEWLNQRLDGAPARSTCEPVETPVVLPGVGEVRECAAGSDQLRVPITLSAPSERPVTVKWLTGFVPGLAGQAEPGADYAPSGGEVTFQPGETTTSVPVPITCDHTAEGAELLVVGFGAPTNARMGGFWGLGFGVIHDG